MQGQTHIKLQTTILILTGTNVQASLKQRNRLTYIPGMKWRSVFTKRRVSKNKGSVLR